MHRRRRHRDGVAGTRPGRNQNSRSRSPTATSPLLGPHGPHRRQIGRRRSVGRPEGAWGGSRGAGAAQTISTASSALAFASRSCALVLGTDPLSALPFADGSKVAPSHATTATPAIHPKLHWRRRSQLHQDESLRRADESEKRSPSTLPRWLLHSGRRR